ncbi:hypothetical protein B0H13DRAFT_691087 [Mycena leptocephala]|nr:hypothetical protein B0H13DRAFT_691087 [Mycena leptocephala]
MFFSLPRAGLAILFITNLVLARPTRRAADCTSQCQPMQSSINASAKGGIAVLCTADVANQYKACLGCEIAISLLSQLEAQAVADSLVANCKTANHPIDNIAVTSISPTAPPAPVTSTSAPTPTSVTSHVTPPTPTPTPTPQGPVSGGPAEPESSSTPSIPTPPSPSVTISQTVLPPTTPATSPSVAFLPSTAIQTPSAGAPVGSAPDGTAPAAPAASTVVDTPTNGAAHHSGGLTLAIVVGVLSVWFL